MKTQTILKFTLTDLSTIKGAASLINSRNITLSLAASNGNWDEMDSAMGEIEQLIAAIREVQSGYAL